MDTSVLRDISYGLYVIGVDDNGRKTGCIVNTVFQITSENPIIAVSMNKNNYTCDVILRTRRFSVSILSEETPSKVISELGFFSGRDRDKFSGISCDMYENLPLVKERCCGHMICDVVATQDTPTHLVILARVSETFKGEKLSPMTYKYYHEVIKGSAPKNAPTYVEEKPLEGSEKYVCTICGYIYEGDLTSEPDSFVCPICGVPKSKFAKL